MSSAQNLARIKSTLEDPQVIEVGDALAVVLTPIAERMDSVPIITAIAWTAVSACKSFGLHPREFVKNFLLIYEATAEAKIIPPPLEGEGQS